MPEPLSKSYTNLINGIDISKNHPNTNITIKFIDGRTQKLEVETLTDLSLIHI